jgi:hypothetical protein
MVHRQTARARARASTAATSALILLGLAGSAAAQNADAEVLFNEAVALETEGNIPKACEAFEASNRIEPRAGTLIRLGQCREKQQLFVSAWSAYKDALTRVKDPAKKKLAEERIKALEPTLSYLTVSVPDDVRVDGLVVTRNGKPVDPVLWNRAVPVDGGSYTIVGSAPGQEPWQTTVEVAPTKDKASIEVPRFKAIETLVTPPTGDGGGVTAPPIGDKPDDPPGGGEGGAPSAFTGKRKLALGLAGVGLVAIGGGVVLGMSATGLEDDAFALCPDPGGAVRRRGRGPGPHRPRRLARALRQRRLRRRRRGHRRRRGAVVHRRADAKQRPRRRRRRASALSFTGVTVRIGF